MLPPGLPGDGPQEQCRQGGQEEDRAGDLLPGPGGAGGGQHHVRHGGPPHRCDQGAGAHLPGGEDPDGSRGGPRRGPRDVVGLVLGQ